MVISHNLIDVFAVADQISVLYLGRLVAQGPASRLRHAGRGRVHDDRHSRRRAGTRGAVDSDRDTTCDRRTEEEAWTSRCHDAIGVDRSSGHRRPCAWRPETVRRLRRPRRPGRLARRLPAGLVEADPRRRERRAPDHHRPDRHLHLLRRAVESPSSSSGNIVNLFVQATFIILLGMAELYALILSEIDLSVGFVGASAPPSPWPCIARRRTGPGGPALIVGLVACCVIGAFQGRSSPGSRSRRSS